MPITTTGTRTWEDRHGTDGPSSSTPGSSPCRRRDGRHRLPRPIPPCPTAEYDQEGAAAYSASQGLPDPPQYVAPAPASTGGEVDELSRLVQMHDSGALADDEFSAAKAQLLGT